MSGEFKHFLLQLGIGSSNTTAYNPRGNSQYERYNDIIWNTILLALESQQLPVNAWQVMVIVVGNGHGDTSSNPRRD